MINSTMTAEARKVLADYIAQKYLETGTYLSLTDTNSAIAYVNDPDAPYFMISVFGSNIDEVDGVYTVGWNDIGNCLDIGNEMLAYDPDEWNITAETTDDVSTPAENSSIIRETVGSTRRETIAAILITLFFAGIIALFLNGPFSDVLNDFLKSFER